MTASTQEIIEKVGSFGCYQLRVLGIISFAVLFCSSVLMVMTFSTAEPPWRCTTNSTSCALNGTFKVGDKDYDYRCNIPRKDWEFAVEEQFDSIVTEWDLVCDTAIYVSLANSLLFIVWIFGAMFASVISDKYGRKTMTFPFTVWTCVCGFVSAFAQEYWVFALFRTLAGIGLGGYSITAFVLALEFVGTRHRSAVGIGIWFAWTFSLCLLALAAYLIPNWRTLSIITSAPGIMFFVFWWFTPESLRWLLVKGKAVEAEKILKTIAEVNGKLVSEEDFMSLINEKEIQNERLGDIRDLFASRAMVHRTLLSWYCWFVCGLVYYGISLATPTIGGNMYLNFFISAVCELAGMLVAIPSLNKLGRRMAIVGCLWGASVVMVTAAFLTLYDDGSTGYLVGKVLAAMVLGKLFITVSFDGAYVYSSELFPTVVRNTALGTSTSAARVGSAFAPYVVYSQRVHPMMPFGIMAVNALICGILCMTLPETNKKAMPDTVKQIDNNASRKDDANGDDEVNDEKAMLETKA